MNEIVDILSTVLPDEWERVVLYGELDESSYEFFFYVKVKNNYIYCYNLPYTTEKVIDEVFGALYAVCIRHKEAPWTYFTLSLDNTGLFDLHFNYDDAIFDRSEWKKKYLTGD